MALPLRKKKTNGDTYTRPDSIEQEIDKLATLDGATLGRRAQVK